MGEKDYTFKIEWNIRKEKDNCKKEKKRYFGKDRTFQIEQI